MRRNVLFLFLMFFAFLLVGCQVPAPDDNGGGNNEGENGENSGNEGGNEEGGNEGETGGEKPDYTEQFGFVEDIILDEIPYFVTDDIELMTSVSIYKAYIEWDSSDVDVIDYDGYVTVSSAAAKAVKLSYIITIEDQQRTGSIDVIVTPQEPEKVAQRFARQFSALISRSYEVQTVFYDLFEVEWYSTNEEVFNNQGVFTEPVNDVDFEIKYVVKCGEYTSEEMSKTLTAAGISDLRKLEEVEKYITDDVLLDLYLLELPSLPNKYEKYNIDIEWKSTNPDVISVDGKITRYVYDRYVTLLCTYYLENGSGGQVKYECIVPALDTSNMSQKEIVENFLSSIAYKEYEGATFGYAACPVLSQSYGSLFFYNNVDSEVTEMLIPVGTKNRTQIKRKPELVVIHDTANYNASALANAKYVQSGYSGSSTGWHYTIGNDGIFRTIPDDEVGYHANGSSDTPFTLLDSGIKATAIKPQVTVGDDLYLYINKQKTPFKLPNAALKLCDDGVIVEIGANGNYYVSKMWDCTSHGFNAVQGGNANGIGIESSVKSGDDYIMTIRMMAKYTAELLITHNLTINRVVQHNTTSGKNCPQAIREASYWYTFKDLVSMEKFAKENLKGYQFAWTSNDTNVMNNQGYIKKGTTADSISYKVVVSLNGQEFLTKTYTTKLTK